jgi:hypothetical protein
MFFRRPRVKEPTFEERLNKVRQAGFTVDSEPGTRIVRIRRDGCAVKIDLKDGSPCVVEPAGVLVCDEIGALTDSGFQKFFLTPSGDRRPALASELKTLHDFQEDLREALGQTSLYNESLGTVSTFYLYDRVKDRDHGVPKRAWE